MFRNKSGVNVSYYIDDNMSTLTSGVTISRRKLLKTVPTHSPKSFDVSSLCLLHSDHPVNCYRSSTTWRLCLQHCNMPKLISHITGAQWGQDGPSTPTQRFFKQYVAAVDSKGYDVGSGLKFYFQDVTFHNQNNAVYHGGEEMWAWMKKLCGVFERIHHDWVHFVEIERDDGTSQIYTQNVRNLWVLGNKAEKPDASIPVTMIAIIGKSGSERTPEGLHFKEVWLYWDTALLAPLLAKDAVVFKTENILHADEVEV
jgi:hypothetical protein